MMKPLKFRSPNFVCKVRGPNNRVYENWRFAADSEAELRQRLEERGYEVLAVDPYDLQEWRDRSKPEKDLANAAKNNGSYKYKDALWGDVKQFLFSLSNDFCGYCEGVVKPTGPGHVEHYRPKSSVRENPKHSGYYWLAYEIENYVPSCQNCNTNRKSDRFPLQDETARAVDDQSLSLEQPLLLNPFSKENPRKHLEFIGDATNLKEFGKLKGLTDIGEKSIEIYDLNRGDLVIDRREAYWAFRDELKLALADSEKKQRIFESVQLGTRRYTIVALPSLLKWLDGRQEDVQEAQRRLKEREAAIENERKMLLSAVS
jgi:hypothetical protein